MPNIIIPPWLEPQRAAPLYTQGMQVGVSAAAQQNEALQAAQRLQMQAAMQAAEIQLRPELRNMFGLPLPKFKSDMERPW